MRFALESDYVYPSEEQTYFKPYWWFRLHYYCGGAWHSIAVWHLNECQYNRVRFPGDTRLIEGHPLRSAVLFFGWDRLPAALLDCTPVHVYGVNAW